MASNTQTGVKVKNNNDLLTPATPSNDSVSEDSLQLNGAPRTYQPMNLDDATPEALAEHIGFDLSAFFVTMRKESERLKTFLYGEWPVTFIRPQDLSKAGFFYLQNEDRVQCAFCRGVVCKWNQDDIPLVEHARHYPRCPFIIGYDVSNVPIGRDPVRDDRLLRSGRDVCGSHGNVEQRSGIRKPGIVSLPISSSLEEYGINVYQKPMHNKFVTITSRVKTLENIIFDNLSPKDLAESGFFFTKGWLVLAFCGIRTTEKDFTLNPWEEHARRQPECYFMRITKGTKFIEACQHIKVFRDNPQSIKQDETTGEVDGCEVRLNSVTLQSSHTDGRQGTTPGTTEGLTRNMFSNKEISNATKDEFEKKPSEVLNDYKTDAVILTKGRSRSFAPLTGHQVKHETSPASEVSIPPPLLENVPSLIQKDERLLCKVCLDSEVGVVFLPCSHLVACTACSVVTTSCPICRKDIKAAVKMFYT